VAGEILIMSAVGVFQIFLFLAVILLLTKPIGAFLARAFFKEKTLLDPLCRPVERLIYRLCEIDESREMNWKEYGFAMLLFSGVSLLVLYVIERAQHFTFGPLNPHRFPGISPALAWNTAVSFTSNTNWQAYVPETTMSYFTQMAGLAYHNFVSAAVGIALAIALIRGIARVSAKTIGNFWVDVTRATLWVLLPACFVIALVLVSQGVIQNFHSYQPVYPLDSSAGQQVIPQGPVASQEAIKELGTNGGGFFNANSAHPYENPTPFTNFLQLILIFVIPSGLTYTLGRMTRSPRHGWAVWGAMASLFLAAVFAIYAAESRATPALKAATPAAAGNLEGKETRFGVVGSSLFATVTTDASCGAVNSMHDSYTPLGGMVPLINILLGEVVFGGVGSGLYGMIVFVIITVFLAGLMVGRTPEYLGKKIEAYDVKMAMLSILVFPVTVLSFAAIASVTGFGEAGITNPGPHGLTQILYAYTSAAGNNGSAFAGINANTSWYNSSLAVAMLLGRFFAVIPILAIAGNLAQKKSVAESAGTFPVTTPLFSTLLVSTILIVGALTFFPVLSLGPILEHLQMAARKLF